MERCVITLFTLLLLSGCASTRFDSAFADLGDEVHEAVERQCLSTETGEALQEFGEAIQTLPEGEQGGWMMIMDAIHMNYLNLLPSCEPLCIDC